MFAIGVPIEIAAFVSTTSCVVDQIVVSVGPYMLVMRPCGIALRRPGCERLTQGLAADQNVRQPAKPMP